MSLKSASSFLHLTWCVWWVQMCHCADEIIFVTGAGTPALCGRTTPRPRRAVHQARLAHSCYIRALCSVYKPCEDGDFREECIIILHLNWAEEHTGELQPRGGWRAGLMVGDMLFELSYCELGFWAQGCPLCREENGLTASLLTRLASISTRLTGHLWHSSTSYSLTVVVC